MRASASPFEGLELTRDWVPDIVLLDLVMPTTSGFEAVKVFKKKPRMRNAILVAFSGLITDEEVERFRRIGFDEVLPKPVPANDLAYRIQGFLARRQLAK